MIFNLIGGGSNAANKFPEFTYTGSYSLLDDGLADDGKTQNWRIKFLTSGVLTFLKLGSGEKGIDVFLLGGGAGAGEWTACGGAGGGYTTTVKNQQITVGTEYSITIGAGGNGRTQGGTTSAFNTSIGGGQPPTRPGDGYNHGGDGGSGGGGAATSNSNTNIGGNGGSDGGNGGAANDGSPGGKGQGSTTREFGESGGTLYAGGGAGFGQETRGTPGAGGGAAAGTSAAANTGGGAGGGVSGANKSGGSGIVVIRNVRAA